MRIAISFCQFYFQTPAHPPNVPKRFLPSSIIPSIYVLKVLRQTKISHPPKLHAIFLIRNMSGTGPSNEIRIPYVPLLLG